MRDEARDVFWFFRVMVYGTVILMVVTALWLLALKPLTNLRTDVTRQTNQYVTTQQTALLLDYEAYLRLDAEIAEFSQAPGNDEVIQGKRNQQQALLGQMRQKAALLDPADVPADIRALLAQR